MFADLRRANDPERRSRCREASRTSFRHGAGSGKRRRGRRELHRRALRAAAASASNAVLVGAKRSATGHPLFVAGPQVGYFFPQFFAEMELAGAGFATRGAVFPGVPFVLIGRGPDFAWSATSSQADNIDLFVETLCDDDRHYVYRGQCQAMRRVLRGDAEGAGVARSARCLPPDDPRAGRRIRDGRRERVAISVQRSTRGREILSAQAFYELNTGRVTSAQRFLQTMNSRRVQLQLVLRRRSRHRVLLERSAPTASARAPIRRCRPRAPATPTGGGSCRSRDMRAGSTRLRD